jgi:hypothetical protein
MPSIFSFSIFFSLSSLTLISTYKNEIVKIFTDNLIMTHTKQVAHRILDNEKGDINGRYIDLLQLFAILLLL